MLIRLCVVDALPRSGLLLQGAGTARDDNQGRYSADGECECGCG